MTEQLDHVGISVGAGLDLETGVAPFAYEDEACESRRHGNWPDQHSGRGQWYYVSQCPVCQDTAEVMLMCDKFKQWFDVQEEIICGECFVVFNKELMFYRFERK